MIFPSGRAKLQKHQSLSAPVQNDFASQLLSKLTPEQLKKIALITPTEKGAPSESGQENSSFTSPDLQNAMNDSNSASMRAPGEDEMGTGNDAPLPGQQPSAQPQNQGSANGWKFDPNTGEPINAIDGAKLVQSGNEWLAGIDPNLTITGFTQKGPAYTITIAPRGAGGKLVSKA